MLLLRLYVPVRPVPLPRDKILVPAVIEVPLIIEPTVKVPDETAVTVKTVVATAKTKMAGIKASAESRIDFSIIEDDAEILLLI